MTQSAVEWLIQALDESNIVDLNWIDSDRYYAIIEQAKEMEKEQVINAYKNGQKIVEQYYKETYKPNDKKKGEAAEDDRP